MISVSNAEALIVTAVVSSRDRSAWPGGVRRWVLGALSTLLVIFSGGTGTAQMLADKDPDARIEVQVRNGLVSLNVRDAPVAEVIRKIGEEAGFETVVLGPLDHQITRSLTEMPVYDAVRRLARETTFIMIHARSKSHAEAAPIKEVRLYRSTLGQPPPDHVTTVKDAVDPEVLAGLSADDARARIRAVQELGRTGEESAVLVLEGVISKDDNPMVRGQAAAALAKIGGERALPALQAALGDRDQSVRIQAVRGLERIGDESSVRILGELLLNDADRRVRRNAAWSLGRLKGELAKSYLEAASRDPDSAVRRSANQTLGRGEEAVEEDLRGAPTTGPTSP